ncbi:DMT family transporter [Rhodobacter maris]|uniref:Drug/metabolite transporter (DMT)-like permease n=1 Tax=Rhodobacter maris TaxID=446682 RepID=A0A285RXZ4_9RHOB|nr:DMT family transporter [Rhodobacter maris]SOB99428.1 drug/metabolite transporter (DMT)-like permease [Rhodobacter maris]
MGEAKAAGGWKLWAVLALPPLFWAGNFIVARASRGDWPPIALSFGRWAIALVALLPFAWPHLKRDAPLYRRYFWRIVLLTLPGVAAFNSLVYWGLQSTTATNGMLLNSTIPLLILALGALFWGQRLSLWAILGLLVSTLGVAVVILQGSWERAAALDFASGDLIIFAAMVAWALYTIGLKLFPPEVNRIGLLAVQIALALPMLAPFLAFEIASGRVPHWSPASVAALVYIGIVPSVLAYLFYTRAVALAGPARAGQFIHLLPVYGAILSAAFLHEPLHLYHAAGFGLILTGIVLAGRGK